MQLMSNHKTVRSNRRQNLKLFNLQSLATGARKGEQLFCMLPSIKKNSKSEDIVKLSTENETLKKTGSIDEKSLEGAKTNVLKER